MKLAPLAATFLAALAGAAGFSASNPAAPVAMSGFLRSHSVSQIGPPQGREWSYKITMLIADGSRVVKGEQVARFDGENTLKMEQDAQNQLLQAQVDASGNAQTLRAEIVQQEDRVETQKKELELLEVSKIDEKAVGAYMDMLISARDKMRDDLDIEQRRLRLKLETERLTRKRALLVATTKSLATRVQMYEVILKKFADEKAAAAVLAPAAGVITYLRTYKREKPKAGGNVNRGTKVLAIVDDKALYVECYLKEEEYGKIQVGDPVSVLILGSRQINAPGKITKIRPLVMKVQDFEKNLPDTHALYDQRAFHVELELDNVPPEAKPEGEVVVKVEHHAV